MKQVGGRAAGVRHREITFPLHKSVRESAQAEWGYRLSKHNPNEAFPPERLHPLRLPPPFQTVSPTVDGVLKYLRLGNIYYSNYCIFLPHKVQEIAWKRSGVRNVFFPSTDLRFGLFSLWP